jgi:hypothetical protein
MAADASASGTTHMLLDPTHVGSATHVLHAATAHMSSAAAHVDPTATHVAATATKVSSSATSHVATPASASKMSSASAVTTTTVAATATMTTTPVTTERHRRQSGEGNRHHHKTHKSIPNKHDTPRFPCIVFAVRVPVREHFGDWLMDSSIHSTVGSSLPSKESR